MRTKTTTIICLLTAGVLSGHLHAESLNAGSGTVSNIDSGYQSIDGGTGTNSYTFYSTQITGLSKFDGSLGTLTGVNLIVSFDYQFSFGIYGDALDGNDPYSMTGTANSDAGFFVSNGSSAIGVVSDFLDVSAACTGGVEGCADVGTESTSIFETQGSVNSGYLAAFTGTGSVTDLFAGFYFPLNSELNSINVDSPYAEGNASMSNIAYSVEYIYTIPEPSAACLLGLSIFGLLARRKRA